MTADGKLVFGEASFLIRDGDLIRPVQVFVASVG